MNDSRMDRDGVKSKFDVYPEQIVDYLALIGDTSDNIPGVPKVGAKTAAKWLNLYDSADGIVRSADEIKGKVGDSLRENIEQLRLSQQLATIRQDMDLDVSVEDLSPAAANIKRACANSTAISSCARCSASWTMRPMKPAAPENQAPTRTTTRCSPGMPSIAGSGKLTRLNSRHSIPKRPASITWKPKSSGFHLSVKPNEAAYIPVAHDYPGGTGSVAARRGAEKNAWLARGRRARKRSVIT